MTCRRGTVVPSLFRAIAVAGFSLLASRACAADPVAGERVFRTQCAACHAVVAGRNQVGPSLFGVVGRVSGTVSGFRYSVPNRDAAITWTPGVLDAYLIQPTVVIPGTTMRYAGLRGETLRADLIAYLETLK